MVLSFHPCFEADFNIICAGRLPNKSDLRVIQKANAVILPQGCTEPLYRMVSSNCANVFPNFNVRFSYPGKTGQAKLFRSKGVLHPETWEYTSLSEFFNSKQKRIYSFIRTLPFVFKFDWGGEGETVFFVETKEKFERLLNRVDAFERSGQYGFLIQRYIKSSGKTLRVAVVGETLTVYWRVQSEPSVFGEHLSTGAYIDNEVDSKTLTVATSFVKQFCSKTNINLAGFDLIFNKNDSVPFLLEINYFFGRQGLGGSEKYYEVLCDEIRKWLNTIEV